MARLAARELPGPSTRAASRSASSARYPLLDRPRDFAIRSTRRSKPSSNDTSTLVITLKISCISKMSTERQNRMPPPREKPRPRKAGALWVRGSAARARPRGPETESSGDRSRCRSHAPTPPRQHRSRRTRERPPDRRPEGRIRSPRRARSRPRCAHRRRFARRVDVHLWHPYPVANGVSSPRASPDRRVFLHPKGEEASQMRRTPQSAGGSFRIRRLRVRRRRSDHSDTRCTGLHNEILTGSTGPAAPRERTACAAA